MRPAVRQSVLHATLGLGIAGIIALSGCGFEVEADAPVGVYGDYPPDGYIATTEPVYYDGRASYWYGGAWYYRDGGRWGRYDREPSALYQRRMHAPPGRAGYEPAGPRVGGGRGGRR